MHTLKVLAIGFALLAGCLVVGRTLNRSATMALVFLPLWLAVAGINMWIGVSKAGYSVAEEAPVFGLVFSIPAVAALIIWWRLSHG
jgi:hypothetical protein